MPACRSGDTAIVGGRSHTVDWSIGSRRSSRNHGDVSSQVHRGASMTETATGRPLSGVFSFVGARAWMSVRSDVDDPRRGPPHQDRARCRRERQSPGRSLARIRPAPRLGVPGNGPQPVSPAGPGVRWGRPGEVGPARSGRSVSRDSPPGTGYRASRQIPWAHGRLTSARGIRVGITRIRITRDRIVRRRIAQERIALVRKRLTSGNVLVRCVHPGVVLNGRRWAGWPGRHGGEGGDRS